MIRRALFCRFSCLPLAVVLFGCGSSEKGPSEAGTINLAFIPKTSNNLVFKMGNDGAQFAARSLGSSTGARIKVAYMAPAELDPAAEEGCIRQAIAEKKDGLLVSCVDDSLTAPIDEAVNAGISVITYDSDCRASKRLGFYGMENEATGAKGADLLASAMGEGKKTIAILTGRAGADNLERRVAGFTERLSTMHPDITIATTVHCQETAESCGSAIEDDVIAAHPALDGLFVVGLWGLLSACTCSDTALTCSCDDTQMPNWKAAASGKLKTVAYDSLPFELTLMKQGYVSALVGQKYFGWGYDTVSLMYEHLTSGTEVSGFIDSGFDVVCPNNAEAMNAKWQAADFHEPLTPACAL
jgi:ribose transport system substrate-binding protein